MASQRTSGPAPTGGRFALWSVLGTAILVLDQVSKFWFERNLDPGIQLPVTSFFNFVLAHNRGAAFSFLADAGGWQHGLFVTLAFVVIILMVRYLWFYNHRTLFALALTLVAAGAAGNLIDRVAHGYVIDFIDLHWQGWHWPSTSRTSRSARGPSPSSSTSCAAYAADGESEKSRSGPNLKGFGPFLLALGRPPSVSARPLQ